MEFIYKCITRCYYKGREWTQGEIFATTDPTDIPPHHFEGGINPKDTEVVKALVNERLGTPVVADDDSSKSDPADTTKTDPKDCRRDKGR